MLMVPFPVGPSHKIIYKECFLMFYPAISGMAVSSLSFAKQEVPIHD